MALSNANRSSDFLLSRIRSQLAEFEKQRPVKPLRELTLKLVDIQETVKKLGTAVGVAAGLSATSARARIRGYLEAVPNEVVGAVELAVVSGISEYGRRVRELRAQGLEILTGPEAVDPATGRPLRPDQYLLVQEGADNLTPPFRE